MFEGAGIDWPGSAAGGRQPTSIVHSTVVAARVGRRPGWFRNALQEQEGIVKKYLVLGALAALLASAPLFSHHAAEGIIDDEVYAMIDDMVADTQHATLDFSGMGADTTEVTVSTRSVRDVENLIDDGLLDYAAMLDGDVTMVIEFDDRGGALVTITQVE
jgi:hypothetical protein